MYKVFYIFLLFFSFFLLNACNSGPYDAIYVRTAFGMERIPGNCSAWMDGCNVFCRPSITKPSEYIEEKINKKCEDDQVVRAFCIDDDPEKRKLCDEIKEKHGYKEKEEDN